MWPFSRYISVSSKGILQGMTDCHSHLLPGVADGVRTAEESLRILEEMERQGLDPAEMSGASDGQMNGSAGTGQNTGMTAQVQQDNRININIADEAQLTTLTGIGATRAQAIIAYREENGPFAAIEDIMNVQGIKEGTFAKIKDEIVVG